MTNMMCWWWISLSKKTTEFRENCFCADEKKAAQSHNARERNYIDSGGNKKENLTKPNIIILHKQELEHGKLR